MIGITLLADPFSHGNGSRITHIISQPITKLKKGLVAKPLLLYNKAANQPSSFERRTPLFIGSRELVEKADEFIE